MGDSCKERLLPAGTTGLGPFPMRRGGLTWANGVTMRSSACLKLRTGTGEDPGVYRVGTEGSGLAGREDIHAGGKNAV